MDIHTGIIDSGRQEVAHQLQRLVASGFSLYILLLEGHWNLTGPQFFSIHLFLEKQYRQMLDILDEVAERIRGLGFYVEANLSAFQALTSLKEEKRVLSSPEFFKEILHGHEQLAKQWRSLSTLAEKCLDFASVDLAGRMLNFHEKSAWMVRSYLS
jgi:starvation-inducible DNA-binding protein